MARFEALSLEEAMMKSATGKRTQLLREYLGYLEQVKEGQAGKLEAGQGQTIVAVRRRLIKAAKLAGKSISARRVGDTVYFWPTPKLEEKPKGRRGRPRKKA